MISQEIRRNFLNYFKDKKHTSVPSSPVVPHDDPTLLFINAGMNQFKDVFLGKAKRDYTRASSSQKCVRVGGKHNDLENVGHTTRHLTFFEMLGNFSFGDYFKKEAIDFAFEVTSKVFGFDMDRVWASVYQSDDEAFALWERYLPSSRIIRLGEKDNFWSMGDTGPCGPCSELLYDRGSNFSSASTPLDDPSGERFLEFWNLVFMQFNRDSSGELSPLPNKSIDTGAGLERVVSLKLGVNTVFETDILRGLIAKVEELSGVKYEGLNSPNAAPFHVIADHIRSLSFAIADGVQPSNVDRGYVLRKILRRAVRYGRMLDLKEPFLAKVYPRLIELMGEDYKELKQAQDRIEEILTLEEEAFLRTLRRGGSILNDVIVQARSTQNKMISGDDAFKLKDTYGLPLEEISLIAKDENLQIDYKVFNELESAAKEKSKAAHKTHSQHLENSIFEKVLNSCGEIKFTGFDHLNEKAKVTAIVKGDSLVSSLNEGEEGLVILNTTPFYAEKGGQVGDTGTISSSSTSFEVTDCVSPYPGVIAHFGTVKKGAIHVDQEATAQVDEIRRARIAHNHTATHLLHWALQQVLGEHIRQAGSLVAPDRLRFDFSHHKALSKAELRLIEDKVNEKIRLDAGVNIYEIPYAEAQKQSDIKQFFGDKYGNSVRVVDIGFSKELCGGTHAVRLAPIGLFKILKETSIAAGIRRIEAVTSKEAEEFVHQTEDHLELIASLLKVPSSNIESRVSSLLEENQALANELRKIKKAQLSSLADAFSQKVVEIGSIPFLGEIVEVEAADVPLFADHILNKKPSLCLLLAYENDGKAQLLVRVSADLVKKGIHAGNIIKAISVEIEGRGGGKPESAQAGGSNRQGIPIAIEKAKKIIEELC